MSRFSKEKAMHGLIPDSVFTNAGQFASRPLHSVLSIQKANRIKRLPFEKVTLADENVSTAHQLSLGLDLLRAVLHVDGPKN